jgi:hypothetical protein
VGTVGGGIAEGLKRVPRADEDIWFTWSQFQDMWPTVVERCSNIGTRPEIAIGRGLADRMDLLALSVAIPYFRGRCHRATTNSLNDGIKFLMNDGNKT